MPASVMKGNWNGHATNMFHLIYNKRHRIQVGTPYKITKL